MSRSIGIAAAIYATLYTTIKDWLRNFFGSATKSIASSIVCGIVVLNLLGIFLTLRPDLAHTVIAHWRNEALLGLIVIFTAVDLAFVENGKADLWATAAFDRFSFLDRYRGKLVIGLIIVTVINFVWSIQPGESMESDTDHRRTQIVDRHFGSPAVRTVAQCSLTMRCTCSAGFRHEACSSNPRAVRWASS